MLIKTNVLISKYHEETSRTIRGNQYVCTVRLVYIHEPRLRFVEFNEKEVPRLAAGPKQQTRRTFNRCEQSSDTVLWLRLKGERNVTRDVDFVISRWKKRKRKHDAFSTIRISGR